MVFRAPNKYNPVRRGYKQEDIDTKPLFEAVYNMLDTAAVRATLLGRGHFNVVSYRVIFVKAPYPLFLRCTV
jgi:hypothetical protein